VTWITGSRRRGRSHDVPSPSEQRAAPGVRADGDGDGDGEPGEGSGARRATVPAMPASWVTERARLEALARAIEPSVRLQTKDGWHWRALAWLAALATAGGMSRRTFLEGYATTFGPLHGYPVGWSVERVEATLVHEARHTRQARWCGFGVHPWLGMPVFAALYLALPLPVGFGLARLLFELDADRAAWRHALAGGAQPDRIRARACEFAGRVCSAHYGWPVPRRLGLALFSRAAEREIAAHACLQAAERTA
jgi:hypothetical protein